MIRWINSLVLQLVKPKTESTKQLCKEWMINNSQQKWIQEPSSVVDVEVVQVLISEPEAAYLSTAVTNTHQQQRSKVRVNQEKLNRRSASASMDQKRSEWLPRCRWGNE